MKAKSKCYHVIIRFIHPSHFFQTQSRIVVEYCKKMPLLTDGASAKYGGGEMNLLKEVSAPSPLVLSFGKNN